jgi:hypothetical protein
MTPKPLRAQCSRVRAMPAALRRVRGVTLSVRRGRAAL